MPNLYFCHSVNRKLGVLRAVLSWEEGKNLLEQQLVEYFGEQFPASNPDSASDFAVLRIFDEEPDGEWRAGFYRFDADIERIEEAVQACTTKLSNLAEEQAASTESKHPR